MTADLKNSIFILTLMYTITQVNHLFHQDRDTYDTFYVIGQNIVSITNHEGNVGAMKTVLTRFDGIEN